MSLRLSWESDRRVTPYMPRTPYSEQDGCASEQRILRESTCLYERVPRRTRFTLIIEFTPYIVDTTDTMLRVSRKSWKIMRVVQYDAGTNCRAMSEFGTVNFNVRQIEGLLSMILEVWFVPRFFEHQSSSFTAIYVRLTCLSCRHINILPLQGQVSQCNNRK